MLYINHFQLILSEQFPSLLLSLKQHWFRYFSPDQASDFVCRSLKIRVKHQKDVSAPKLSVAPILIQIIALLSRNRVTDINLCLSQVKVLQQLCLSLCSCDLLLGPPLLKACLRCLSSSGLQIKDLCLVAKTELARRFCDVQHMGYLFLIRHRHYLDLPLLRDGKHKAYMSK